MKSDDSMSKDDSRRRVPEKLLTISTVERETGLSKDTLRVWERRYGFPTPGRDANGERVYGRDEVQKLTAIKRLMDRGARPGKVVGLSLAELMVRTESGERAASDPPELIKMVGLVAADDVVGLRQCLDQSLLQQGLERFLLDTVAPLNLMIGEAWMRGELQVFEEHLYTEVMRSLLRTVADSISHPLGAPRVLLTTLPNEQHVLGLLMAECMLRMQGATCLALGPQTPASEIVRAVEAQRVDVVGLSFSPAYPVHTAVDTLAALRGMLPAGVAIWVGGSNPALFRRRLDGIQAVRDLAAIPHTVANWRNRDPER